MEAVKLYRRFEEIGEGDREHFAKRVSHWQRQVESAVLALKQAKKNNEEARFWVDARRKAEKKLSLCALMSLGEAELDFQKI